MAVEHSRRQDRAAWRDWSRARLEREYSPSSAIPSSAPFIDAWVEASRIAYASLEVRRDLRYGEGADETLDLFPARGRASEKRGHASLVVFLHGGYWQEVGKADSVFPAPGLVVDAIAYAAVEYTLAPRASVAAIVEQAVKATSWVRANARELGVDPARIVVAGHSAGAQLAAMVLLADAQARANATRKTAEPPFAGGLLISGVYDLEPLVGTYINDALRLDVEEARKLSPQLIVERVGALALPPLEVTWGEVEPSEFARQSRRFAATWAEHGGQVQAFEVAGRNHFDIVPDMADASTEVGTALRRLVERGLSARDEAADTHG